MSLNVSATVARLLSLTVAIALAVSIIEAQAPRDDQAVFDSKMEPVFNGVRPDDWVTDNASAGRIIADGVLQVDERAGWVRTRRTDFAAFSLRFSARADWRKTRAVLAFNNTAPADPKSEVLSAIPLLDGTMPRASSGRSVLTLDLFTTTPRNLLKPADEWQAYELTRRAGGRLTGTLNGRVILDVTSLALGRGWIGFRAQGGALDVQNLSLSWVPPSTSEPVIAPSDPDVTLPQPIAQAKPRYTRDALARQIQGSVLVACLVDVKGNVKSAQIVRPLDQTYGLDNEALRAAFLWRFTPGLRNGVPVPTVVFIQLSFAVQR